MGGHTNLSSSYIIIMRANFLGCTYEVFDNVFSHEHLYFICVDNFQQKVNGFIRPGIPH